MEDKGVAYVTSWPLVLSPVECNKLNQILFHVCIYLTAKIIRNKSLGFTLYWRDAKLLEKPPNYIELCNTLLQGSSAVPFR